MNIRQQYVLTMFRTKASDWKLTVIQGTKIMDDSRPLCIHNDEARKTRKGEAAPRWLATPLPHPIFPPPIPSVVCPSILDNVHSWDQIDLASYDTFGLIGIAKRPDNLVGSNIHIFRLGQYLNIYCWRVVYCIYLEHYCPHIYLDLYFLPYVIGWNKTHTIHGYCFMRHAAFVKSL